jgi:hypothetical protein
MDIGTLFQEGNCLVAAIHSIGDLHSSTGKFPKEIAHPILERVDHLVKGLPELEEPSSVDELLISELRRKLTFGHVYLGTELEGIERDARLCAHSYGIEREDFEAVDSWLKTHKHAALEAKKRLDAEGYVPFAPLPIDDPSFQGCVEDTLKNPLLKYHTVLSKLLPQTKVKGFDGLPIKITADHSLFDTSSLEIVLGAPGNIIMDAKEGLVTKSEDLLIHYAHEAVGHGTNELSSRDSDLPLFMKVSVGTMAAGEAIAQFYEGVVLDEVASSPEIQEALGIDDAFVQRARDIHLVGRYNTRFIQYADVLFTFGDIQTIEGQRRIYGTLCQFALEPQHADAACSMAQSKILPDGRMGEAAAASSFVYLANPVERALKVFEGAGMSYNNPSDRNIIDTTLRLGYYTPQGLVDKARLVVQGKMEP